jgi:hypothetical protein
LKTETDLSEALKQLEGLQKTVEGMKVEHVKEVASARAEGFAEAKKKVTEHYQSQVAEISDDGFRRGAKAYYLKGVAEGYRLGLDAGKVSTDSELRVVPNVELPEIEIPEEEEEDEEVDETGGANDTENIPSPKN